MTEIWKDVLNYEDQYQVSDLGRIRSKDRLVNTKVMQHVLLEEL